MRILIYFAVLALVTGLALWRGTAVERALAATVLAGNLGTLGIVQLGSSEPYSSVSQWYFLIDALLVVLLCGVALRWPTWVSMMIAAFQINGLLGHLVKIMAPDVIPLSYALLVKVWGWPMLAVLLLARFRPNMRQSMSGARWPYFSRVRGGHTTAIG